MKNGRKIINATEPVQVSRTKSEPISIWQWCVLH